MYGGRSRQTLTGEGDPCGCTSARSDFAGHTGSRPPDSAKFSHPASSLPHMYLSETVQLLPVCLVRLRGIVRATSSWVASLVAAVVLPSTYFLRGDWTALNLPAPRPASELWTRALRPQASGPSAVLVTVLYILTYSPSLCSDRWKLMRQATAQHELPGMQRT